MSSLFKNLDFEKNNDTCFFRVKKKKIREFVCKKQQKKCSAHLKKIRKCQPIILPGV